MLEVGTTDRKRKRVAERLVGRQVRAARFANIREMQSEVPKQPVSRSTVEVQ